MRALGAVLVLLTCGLAFGGQPDCSRLAGTLPSSDRAPGVADNHIPIEHIIVLMEENHSFDNFFGKLNDPDYYGDEIDGLSDGLGNPDGRGGIEKVFHQESYCVANTNHSWDGSHQQFNDGKNDGFVITNGGGHKGARALGYYDQNDLGYLYAMADRFAVADRFFSSLLGPTFPNRAYLYAATSFGHLRNNFRISDSPTIFSELSKYGVSWKYYHHDMSIARELIKFSSENLKHFAFMGRFKKDLVQNKLPSVVFLETSEIFGEEHPPFNFQLGQRETAGIINALLRSDAWLNSVLFLTYDEHGGYYDHVAPPEACRPDGLDPILKGGDTFKARFDRYGFRVPFVAISPFVKRHYVSHVTYDHTSILKFIETKFNLPALTARDANADAMLDLFDFDYPQYDYPRPALPEAHWGKCHPFRAGE